MQSVSFDSCMSIIDYWLLIVIIDYCYYYNYCRFFLSRWFFGVCMFCLFFFFVLLFCDCYFFFFNLVRFFSAFFPLLGSFFCLGYLPISPAAIFLSLIFFSLTCLLYWCHKKLSLHRFSWLLDFCHLVYSVIVFCCFLGGGIPLIFFFFNLKFFWGGGYFSSLKKAESGIKDQCQNFSFGNINTILFEKQNLLNIPSPPKLTKIFI